MYKRGIMKKTILIILSLLSFNVFACKNKIPLSDAIKAIAMDGSATGVSCKDRPEEQCLCFEGVAWEYYDLVDNMVADKENPIYSKSETESCVNIADCDAKHAAKVCSDSEETPIKNYDQLEVYCSKLTGYPQIAQGKKFQLNQAKKDAYEANKAAKQAQEAAFAQAEKSMKCGKRVQQLLLVRNASKGLTKGQIKQLVKDYADIKDLLDSGSLESAKEEILAVTADGTRITEDDKTAMAAELDACKP